MPELPRLSRELGSPRFPLQRTTLLADDPAFTIAGAHARLTGGHARGVDDAWASNLHLLSRLGLEGASAATATLTPVGLERELELRSAAVVERVVVPRSDPICFFEWVASQAVPLTLTWRVPAPVDAASGSSPALRWRTAERALLVEFGRDRALYVFSHAPTDLAVAAASVPPGRPGGIDVRARLEPGASQAVRLAVAGIGAGADSARILRVMDRCHVVVPTRRAAAARTVDERLAVEAPDEALADSLAWSKVRLAIGDLPGQDPTIPLSDRTVRAVLAALASGDPEPVRLLVAAPPPAPGGAKPPATDHRDAALHLLVAARYLAWTGDLPTVKAAWDGLRARAEACLAVVSAGVIAGATDPGADAGDDVVIAGALREMVAAAEASGDVDLTRRLRAAVGERGGRVNLAPRLPAGGSEPARDTLLHSAAVVEAVVHGLLGAEPDAPRGRLVIRPRLPGSWTRFTVRKLAVGGAAVILEYNRAGGTHEFSLRQERGAAPLRVILEPELEGLRLVRARVDGAPAELDAAAANGRLRVPVQLVLDHERRVALEIHAADA